MATSRDCAGGTAERSAVLGLPGFGSRTTRQGKQLQLFQGWGPTVSASRGKEKSDETDMLGGTQSSRDSKFRDSNGRYGHPGIWDAAVHDRIRRSFGSRRKEKEIFVDPNSSASSSEAESEEDDVMKLLLKAQKAGRGKGTTSDALLKPKRKDKVDRYPMLSQARSSKDVSGDGLEQAILQTIAGQGSDKKLPETSLQTLVTLELLKTIRGKSKARSSMSRTKDDSSDDSSDDSLEENSKLRGAGKAIRDFRQGHRKMKKDPIRHVKRYVQEVEESLGVQGTNVAYNLSDYSRRLQWGKQRTLFRIHVAVSELLQTQLKGHHELATLQSVQLLRAVHQSCLDGGSWRAAALLLQHPDPLDKPKFGGEPGQLEHIASYLKAIQDLERRSLAGADPGEDGGKKGKKGKKQKEDDHTDQ